MLLNTDKKLHKKEAIKSAAIGTEKKSLQETTDSEKKPMPSGTDFSKCKDSGNFESMKRDLFKQNTGFEMPAKEILLQVLCRINEQKKWLQKRLSELEVTTNEKENWAEKISAPQDKGTRTNISKISSKSSIESIKTRERNQEYMIENCIKNNCEKENKSRRIAKEILHKYDNLKKHEDKISKEIKKGIKEMSKEESQLKALWLEDMILKKKLLRIKDRLNNNPNNNNNNNKTEIKTDNNNDNNNNCCIFFEEQEKNNKHEVKTIYKDNLKEAGVDKRPHKQRIENIKSDQKLHILQKKRAESIIEDMNYYIKTGDYAGAGILLQRVRYYYKSMPAFSVEKSELYNKLNRMKQILIKMLKSS